MSPARVSFPRIKRVSRTGYGRLINAFPAEELKAGLDDDASVLVSFQFYHRLSGGVGLLGSEKNKCLTDYEHLATNVDSEVVKIGKRYTVVIPKSFREKLGVKEGQLTEVTLDRGKLVLVPKISDPFKRLSELIGDITYDERTEKKAERWLLGRGRT